MSEGGLLFWRTQKVDASRGPAGSYKGIRKPLPEPPAGKMWIRDADTGEWSVVDRYDGSGEVVPLEQTVEDSVWEVVENTSSVEGEEYVDPLEQRKVTRAQRVSEGEIVVFPGELQEVVDGGTAFYKHVVDPDRDTFQGLCLRYKVSATELRRANGMLGSSLTKDHIKIPVNKKNRHMTQSPEAWTKDQAIQRLVERINGAKESRGTVTRSEARAYLELADWDYEAATKNALADLMSEDSYEAPATENTH